MINHYQWTIYGGEGPENQLAEINNALFRARHFLQYAAALGGRPYERLCHDVHTGAPYWATFDERYCRTVLNLNRENCLAVARDALKRARELNKIKREMLI